MQCVHSSGVDRFSLNCPCQKLKKTMGLTVEPITLLFNWPIRSMIHHLQSHDVAQFHLESCPYCFVSTTWVWIRFGTSNKIPNKSSKLSVEHWSEKPRNKKYVLSPSPVWSFLLVCMLDCLILFFIVACSFSSCSEVNGVHSLFYFLYFI